MEMCRLYYGNRIKLGNKKMHQVEIELDDDDDTVAHTYFQEESADKTTMSKQNIIDDDRKPIDGFDHIDDLYINIEVKLLHEDKELYGSFIVFCLDKNGRMIGNPESNPYLNTILYQNQFDDGTTAAHSANIIAENMYKMCTNKGYQEDSLHMIVDIRFRKNAIKDGYVYKS